MEKKTVTSPALPTSIEDCPLYMQECQYKKPFLEAVIINFILFALIAISGNFIFDYAGETKEKIITIDMSRYEVQGNEADKPKSAPGGSSTQRTAAATEKNANVTPYAGGVEEQEFGVKGAMEQASLGAKFNEGNGADAGTGSTATGTGTGSGTGSGSGIGAGQNGGNGYVDLNGYIAKLNRIKKKPVQAIKRHLRGTATFSVSFNGSGVVTNIEMISSSGHSILDNAARKLIQDGGNITNTTGHSTVETVSITYE